MRRRRSLSSASSGIVYLSVSKLSWFADDGIAPAAAEDLSKPAVLQDREYEDRDAVLARQRNCRRIHHLQIARQYVEIAELVEPYRTRHLERIGIIDAINLGRFQQGV